MNVRDLIHALTEDWIDPTEEVQLWVFGPHPGQQALVSVDGAIARPAPVGSPGSILVLDYEYPDWAEAVPPHPSSPAGQGHDGQETR